jgi:hypothetical protein
MAIMGISVIINFYNFQYISLFQGENSYAYEEDKDLGVALIDRFSHSVSTFFNLQTGITVGNNVIIQKNEKKNTKKKN